MAEYKKPLPAISSLNSLLGWAQATRPQTPTLQRLPDTVVSTGTILSGLLVA